jgi:uncharacterized membrane protein (DUF106 family)
MNKEETKVRSLKPIKLKDKQGRSRLVLKLEDIFGFKVETLVIDKVKGQSSKIIISAIITEEVLKNEKNAIEKNRKEMESLAKSKTKTLKRLEKKRRI